MQATVDLVVCTTFERFNKTCSHPYRSLGLPMIAVARNGPTRNVCQRNARLHRKSPENQEFPQCPRQVGKLVTSPVTCNFEILIRQESGSFCRYSQVKHPTSAVSKWRKRGMGSCQFHRTKKSPAASLFQRSKTRRCLSEHGICRTSRVLDSQISEAFMVL